MYVSTESYKNTPQAVALQGFQFPSPCVILIESGPPKPLIHSPVFRSVVRELLLVAGFGALGAVGRFSVSGWVYHALGPRFAYGTLAVNVVGCFLLALLSHVAQTTDTLSPEMRTGLGIGFLGAFTTFSTFGYETVRFVEEGAYTTAAANIAANVVLGIAAVWLGLVVARAWVGGA